MYLDTGLQFRAQRNISLKKAKRGEDRFRRLVSIFGLGPEFVRHVQVATVKAVGLYGAEIW